MSSDDGCTANSLFAVGLNSLHTLQIGDERYVAMPPGKELTWSKNERLLSQPSLITVLVLEDRFSITKDWLRSQLQRCSTQDDVFRAEFLSGIIFTGASSKDAAFEEGVEKILRDHGVKWTKFAGDRPALAPGPYLLFGMLLFEAWKLCSDTHGAFVMSLLPGLKRRFESLRMTCQQPQKLSIAVPSRLQRQEVPGNPLSGLRIAVKDNFHIAGVRTSLCNWAYYHLYPAPSKTAACIEKLISAGSIIVGTTKLASFAATEEPTECIDFQAPWNPRADGYQSPAGSSSGSGAAIAAYEWLDIAIGSDTSGSGRRPGHWNGCFAMRPSHGVISTEGFIPSFRQFDVPTFFGRDLHQCRVFAGAWYGDMLPSSMAHELPPRIVVATDYLSLISNQAQLAIIEQFITDLEDFLDAKRENVSFEALWSQLPPEEAQGLGLVEFMKDACRNSFFHDDFHSLDQFRKDYEQKYAKLPYVSPPVRWQWELSEKITEIERDIAVERLEIYRKWFSTKVMQVERHNTMVVLPVEEISPRYRDELPTKRFYPEGVPMLFLSPILRGPELVVPAGQVPFKSKVTGRLEYLPVGISLLASPGMDLHLMDLVAKCLQHARRPTVVQAGKNMFQLEQG